LENAPFLNKNYILLSLELSNEYTKTPLDIMIEYSGGVKYDKKN
jgi:hypothetical protein